MEKYQQWRDEKAEELKQISDKEGRREKTKEFKEGELYIIAACMKAIKAELPEEFQAAEVFYRAEYASIENSPDWIVEDVSDKISDELGIIIEFNALQEVLSAPRELISYYARMPSTYEQFLKVNSTVVQSEELKTEIEAAREEYIRDNEDAIKPYITRRDKIKVVMDRFDMSAVKHLFDRLGLDKDYEKEEDHPIHQLVDILTNGEYLNIRNLNHVVMAQIKPQHRNQSFKVDSPIVIDRKYGDQFFMESGENAYVKAMYKPIMIMTPYSEGGRTFMRECVDSQSLDQYREVMNNPNRRGTFMIKSDGSLVNPGFESEHIFNELFFLANYPFQTINKNNGKAFFYSQESQKKHDFTWADMFDIIVDLKAGKVFKRKSGNRSEIERNIEHYRDVLKEIFNIDLRSKSQ